MNPTPTERAIKTAQAITPAAVKRVTGLTASRTSSHTPKSAGDRPGRPPSYSRLQTGDRNDL